jgi:hypothetical protein
LIVETPVIYKDEEIDSKLKKIKNDLPLELVEKLRWETSLGPRDYIVFRDLSISTTKEIIPSELE